MTNLYEQDFVLWAEHQANLIRSGKFEQLDTENLIEEVEDMGNRHKDTLESHLIRLMMHIIRWKIQPQERSSSWQGTIHEARKQIRRSRKKMPSLNETFINSIWKECFKDATEDAERETDLKSTIQSLSWQEVFEKEYLLESQKDD